MKKLVSLLLVLILLLPVLACAEETQEITPELAITADQVLLDYQGIKVYLTGEHEYVDVGLGGFVYFNVVVINDSDKKMRISMFDSSINDWEVSAVGVGEINAGKKKKDTISFSCKEADVNSYEEIQKIEFKWWIYDKDNYETVYKSDAIVLAPNR